MSKTQTPTEKPPVILNDVIPPLVLFKHFLDDYVVNGGYEPLTEADAACLEGGAIAISRAIEDLRKVHNYIDELEMNQRGDE